MTTINKDNIVFVGDIHGAYEDFYDIVKHTVPPNSAIIQVGDFGLGFGHTAVSTIDIRFFNSINTLLHTRNSELFIVRGNHDNPKVWMGGMAMYGEHYDHWQENIHLVLEYERLNVNDTRIVFFGGAISIDRMYRKDKFSYWKDEHVPIVHETDIQCEDAVDIVVAHDVPHEPYSTWNKNAEIVRRFAANDPQLMGDIAIHQDILTKFNDDIAKRNGNLKYSWVHGHYHEHRNSQSPNGNIVGLGINEVYAIPSERK